MPGRGQAAPCTAAEPGPPRAPAAGLRVARDPLGDDRRARHGRSGRVSYTARLDGGRRGRRRPARSTEEATEVLMAAKDDAVATAGAARAPRATP